MAHVNGEAERAFFEKLGIALSDPEAARDQQRLQALKKTKTLLQILDDPIRNLPRAVLKQSVNAGLKKTSGAHNLNLFHQMTEHFGHDWWDWDPATVRTELSHAYQSVPDQELMNFMGAMQLTMRTNAPFEHWHHFEKVGHAIAGNTVDFRQVQPLEPTDLSVAYRVLGDLRPDKPYMPEVYAYGAACCHDAGMVYMPPDLFPEPCQAFLTKQSYDHPLALQVQRIWHEGTKADTEAALIQIARLREIEGYHKDA